jgi:hypothetical protein
VGKLGENYPKVEKRVIQADLVLFVSEFSPIWGQNVVRPEKSRF